MFWKIADWFIVALGEKKKKAGAGMKIKAVGNIRILDENNISNDSANVKKK